MTAAGQDTYESAAKIKHWQEMQQNFLRQTGLKRQSDREQVPIVSTSSKRVESIQNHATISSKNTVSGDNEVRKIAEIDIEKYSGVAERIRSNTVVLTENQAQHIIARRGVDFYEKYREHFAEIAEDPDYIFADKKHPNTALACKSFWDGEENVHLVIRLAVESDDPNWENSIITVLKENRKRYAQRLRNNTPLYKKE